MSQRVDSFSLVFNSKYLTIDLRLGPKESQAGQADHMGSGLIVPPG